MLNKNLRSILYYVVGVSAVCLMIELSKRVPSKELDTSMYIVHTAKVSELATEPSQQQNNLGTEDNLIPKRNRGRVKTEKKPKALPRKSITLDNEIRDTKADKEKFREWKKTVTISKDEMGLFKKWKQEQGLSKKQLKEKNTVEEEDNYEEITENVIHVKENKESKLKIKYVNDKYEYDDSEKSDDVDIEDLIDYPTGITEYEPPSSEHSCSVSKCYFVSPLMFLLERTFQ